MTVKSMTGYGRAEGAAEGLSWKVELKAVNGKGLEIRPRMPAVFEGLEAVVRDHLSKFIQRGNINVFINLDPGSQAANVVINDAVLEAYAKAAKTLEDRFDFKPARAADLLALRGVAEFSNIDLDEDAKNALTVALGQSLEEAARDLNISRSDEGVRLAGVLTGQIDEIAALITQAEACAADQPAKLHERLKEQVSTLIAEHSQIDQARIAQEVALLATKADVREELDRLKGHVEAARNLLASDQAIGRAFDFLAQEFFREANTLCSKSTSSELTQVGLNLKSVIEQVREQVRNLE